MTNIDRVWNGMGVDSAIEHVYQQNKRKKESRARWYARYLKNQKAIDEAWHAMQEGVDAAGCDQPEVGSKD